MTVRALADRIHASTALIGVGVFAACFASAGFRYWHHVALTAAPNILLAGLVVTGIDFRRLGWRQLLAQTVVAIIFELLPVRAF